jgi:tetratricopeptide (TPR) repeat protein
LYITNDGEPLMARNIDFSAYEMEQTIQKGIQLFYNQKYDECIGVFESVTAKQNNNFEANLWLAKTYVEQKKYYDANNQFEKCIAIDPNNISPLIERKEMNYAQKSWRAYTSDMEKLKLKSEYVFSADDYFKCGYAYSEIYEKDEALNHYNMAIGLDPQMGSAYNNRGVIYLDKGNKSQALLDYGMAIKNTSKTDKESLGLYYSNRGNLYYNMKRKAEACADFKKGAAVDNQNCKNMLRYCK